MNTLTAILATLLLASAFTYNSDNVTSIAGDNESAPTAERQVQDIPPPPTDEISIGD
jgi:hypothetical protein